MLYLYIYIVFPHFKSLNFSLFCSRVFPINQGWAKLDDVENSWFMLGETNEVSQMELRSEDVE